MTQKERQKLIRVLALLSSDRDGEVLGAAKAAIRLLEKNNTTFDGVISGIIGGGREEPEGVYDYTQRKAREERKRRSAEYRHERDNERFKRAGWRLIIVGIYNAHYPSLNEWEQDFVTSLFERKMNTITDNQWKVVKRIARKMEARYGY